MSQIVVGIDDSPGSQDALEWALEEARLREATLRMVHAVPPLGVYSEVSTAPVDDTQDDTARAERAARALLASALERAGGEPAGVSVQLVPRVGSAASVLVEEAGEDGLLVVGSRGRGGFAGLLLGSVSQQAVQHARCPVVVTPAEL